MGKILSVRFLTKEELPPPSVFFLPSFRKSTKEQTKPKDPETNLPQEKPAPPKPESEKKDESSKE